MSRNGRIYKIICSKSNDVYVGSTFNALRSRMSQHHADFMNARMLATYPSFAQYGWESLKMIHIASYHVCDRHHLFVYETLWINKLKSVNKVVPFQPLKPHMINKPKATAKTKQLQDREEFRERMKEVSNEKLMPCECGGQYIVRYGANYFGAHERSIDHKYWMGYTKPAEVLKMRNLAHATAVRYTKSVSR